MFFFIYIYKISWSRHYRERKFIRDLWDNSVIFPPWYFPTGIVGCLTVHRLLYVLYKFISRPCPAFMICLRYSLWQWSNVGGVGVLAAVYISTADKQIPACLVKDHIHKRCSSWSYFINSQIIILAFCSY